MKKSLKFGIAVLIVSAGFVSCSKSDNLYDANAVKEKEQKQQEKSLKQTYTEAFSK